jgi:hypothetical protein
MMLKPGHLMSVARYKVISEPSGLPRYIAIYKYGSQEDLKAWEKTPEVAAAGKQMKEMRETWGQKIQITSMVQCELDKEW